MRWRLLIVEQLEEAATHLDRNTPTGARLALILVDNLAELSLRRYALSVLEEKADGLMGEPSTYTQGTLKKIRRYFGEALNFVLREGNVLTPDEWLVFKIGHEFRREAYHRGLLRENLTIPVAWTYLGTFSNVSERLSGGNCRYDYNSQSDINRFLTAHGFRAIPTEDHSAWFSECCPAFASIAAKVRGKGQPSLTELKVILQNDLHRRLKDIDELLRYYVMNSVDVRVVPHTPDGCLKWLLFWRDDVPDGKPVFDRLRDYPEPVTERTLARWGRGADSIQQSSGPGDALRRFNDIDRELSLVHEAVKEGAARLGEHWENQLDEMRLGDK